MTKGKNGPGKMFRRKGELRLTLFFFLFNLLKKDSS